MQNSHKTATCITFIAYLVGAFGCFHAPKHPIIANSPAKEPTTLERNLPSPKIGNYAEFWDDSRVDLSSVQLTRKLIALTFDDAPASTLEEIIGVFLHFNATHEDAPATATIFCNGKNVTSSSEDGMQVAFAAGFEFGNHTQNHKNLSLLPLEEIHREIMQTDQILQRFDGQPTHLLRTPYGNVSELVIQAAQSPLINWFIDTLDWTGRSAEAIYDEVWTKKQSGAIVLMHDGYLNTVEALKKLLPDLYEAGYQAVTVSQMAKAHHCPLRRGSIYTRARRQN
jgi:peptidoglycan/xylan/chitin deacetylase (PgdA/CDA1 family)